MLWCLFRAARRVAARFANSPCAAPGPTARAAQSARGASPGASDRNTRSPLFTPGRRRSADPPPPPVLAQTPGEPTPPPNLVLAGVVVDQDGARAIVRDSETNQTMSLRTGDTVKEWRVEHIEPRRLVLVLGDRSTEFSLFRGGAVRVCARVISAPDKTE